MVDLEALLNRFYSGTLLPQQIHEIDRQLTLFKSQPDAYRQCEVLLFNQEVSVNENIKFYALSVYEEFIQRQFIKISLEEQLRVKNQMLMLLQDTLNSSKSVTSNSTNKLIMIIADIAKYMWPNEFPDLLQIIHTLILTKESRSVGLLLLKVTIEEFTSQKRDLDSKRREALLFYLKDFLSSFLILMKQVIEGVYHEAAVDETSGGGSHSRSLTGNSYQFPGNSVSSSVNALTLSLNTPVLPHALRFNEPQAEMAILTMDTIQLIFGHVNIYWNKLQGQQELLTADLLEILMVYSKLNDSQNIKLGLTSLTVVTDLLEKKNLRMVIIKNGYAGLLYKHLLEILQNLTRSFNVSGNSLLYTNDLDEDYRMKLVEFIKGFIRNCYSSFNENTFSIEQFFENLYRFTFNSADIYWLNDALDIWNEVFLEYYGDIDVTAVALALNRQNTSDKKILQIINLKGGIVALGKELIRRSLFESNASELSRMSSEDSLEEKAGDLEADQTSLSVKMDIVIEKVMELFPTEFVNDLYSSFTLKVQNLNEVLKALSSRSVNSLNQIAQYEHLITDIKYLISLLGKLHNVMYEHDEFNFAFLQQNLSIIKLFGAYFSSNPVDTLKHSLEKLTAESIGVINAYSRFIPKIKSTAAGNEFMNAICPSLISLLSIQDKLVSPAVAQLLVTICDVIRPEKLFEFAGIGDFFNRIHEYTLSFHDVELKKKCYYAVACGILKCSPGNSEAIQQQMGSFLAGLTVPFNEISVNSSNLPVLEGQIIHVLIVLISIINAIKNERLALRNHCFVSMNSVVPKVNEIYALLLSMDAKSLSKHADLLFAMLEFTFNFQECFKSNLNSMKSTLGSDLISFIHSYLQANLTQLIVSDGNFIVEFLTKFSLFVQSYSDNNNLNLTLSVIFWLIETAFTYDQLESFRINIFDTLHCIFVSKYRQISSVESQLSKCFEIYHHCLKSHQLELYQKSLIHLMELNSKHVVFEKHFNLFMNNYVPVLFEVLVEQRYDLAKEETTKILYQIVSLKTDGKQNGLTMFYQDILVNFLEKAFSNEVVKKKIYDGIKMEDDFPTFSEQLGKIVNDIIYYKKIFT